MGSRWSILGRLGLRAPRKRLEDDRVTTRFDPS